MSELSQTLSFDDIAGPARRDPAAWLATRVLARHARRLSCGSLTVRWPTGTTTRHAGSRPGPDAEMRIDSPALAARVMFGGATGFADSYMEGEWNTPDLTAVLRLMLANEGIASVAAPLRVPAVLLSRLRHARRANHRSGSRRNIAAHYDLGNDFYSAWLDPTMTYSSGLFELPGVTLESAQAAKYDRIAAMAGIRPGDHVLEIGCGWGGFAIHAARRFGCRVTALTVSAAQAEWAQRAVDQAGLSGRVEIRLQDYRDVAGQFDRIVSIEMFEAVGEAFWPVWFDAVRQRLRPGGAAAVQVITIDDQRYPHYRRSPDFIQQRVFPGGMLPSPSAFRAASEARSLAITQTLSFGKSYARTLREWRDRFEAAWPNLSGGSFDERFRRLWRFYLCYCEAGFEAGSISVSQYRLERLQA